jgi:hypothetical protein
MARAGLAGAPRHSHTRAGVRRRAGTDLPMPTAVVESNYWQTPMRWNPYSQAWITPGAEQICRFSLSSALGSTTTCLAPPTRDAVP